MAVAEKPREEIDKKIDGKITTQKCLILKMQGKSYKEIAGIFGVTKQAIHNRLKKVIHLVDPNRAEAWEKNKTVMLSNAEMDLILNAVNPVQLRKASTNNCMYGFQVAYNANRLERGESTDNIAVQANIGKYEGMLSDIATERARLLAQCQDSAGENDVNSQDNVTDA